jgi:glycerophosphoryl diester phosphodiesterase
MKIIAHRGNLDGPNPLRENSLDYIDEAIKCGFDVEIDIREDNGLFLGHDNPQYHVTFDWLIRRKKYLWIHCKNVQALDFFSETSFNYFWHENDQYTITSHGIGWVYPGKKPYHKSIIVLPEITDFYHSEESNGYLTNSKGICTDFCNDYKRLFFKSVK